MSRLGMGAVIAIVGVILLAAGLYEWNQIVTCGPGSTSRCHAGKRRHPHRAEGLWVVGVIGLVAGGGLVVRARRA
jgi:uncharacterized membrane protein YidH (DUF202 family)